MEAISRVALPGSAVFNLTLPESLDASSLALSPAVLGIKKLTLNVKNLTPNVLAFVSR